jgi:hypothetical protein
MEVFFMGVIYLEFNGLSRRRGISKKTVENSRTGGKGSQQFKTDRHAAYLLQGTERLEGTKQRPNISKNFPLGNTSILLCQLSNPEKKSSSNIIFLSNRRG